MTIKYTLVNFDPSRYVVHQMLDYSKKLHHSKIIRKTSKGICLFRTEPFIDELYNYAYIIKPHLSKKDLIIIKKFFRNQTYNIKISEKNKKCLLSYGMKFKYIGYNMIADNINKLLPETRPKSIRILEVNNKKSLNDYKIIFSEAFECTLSETNNKFGFLDKIIINKNNRHIKTFVLYEDKIPVCTGSYYAFQKFSIENIGTRKKFRGKGYAYLIMCKLLKEAKKLKYTQACLTASESGSKVYAKVGFQTINTTDTFIP
jgi:predicted GNAT family acetyltransferase